MKDNGSAPTIGMFRSTGLDRWRVLLSLAENAGVGVSPGSRCFGLFGGVPFPRQQRFELMPFGPSGHDAFKHIGQPAQRLDTVQFRRLYQRRDHGPVASTIVVSSEKRVLSRQSHGSDSALDRVRVCALTRCTVLSGGNPGRQTLAPAGSTRGGSGGDEWSEALREKTPLGGTADRAGRNVSEHRAGLETVNVGADPPYKRGRSPSSAKRARNAAGDPTGVVMAARTGHEQCATREVCDRGTERQLRANGEPVRASAGGRRWRMGS